MEAAGAGATFTDVSRALTRCTSTDQAWALLTEAVQPFGYISIDYGLARLTPGLPGFTVIHHQATFGWMARYVDRDYARHDRITRVQVSRTTPFTYAEVWNAPAESERQQELEDEIRSRGVVSGLAIPLHGPGPMMAAVDLGHPGSEEEHARIDAEHRPLLVMFAALFNERMHALLRVADRARAPLTEDERLCLQWAARGKTTWEAAVILSVSERAVKARIASASAKLDARTRAQAVAAALAHGLITV